MPTASFASVTWMVPSLVTLLLLSIVIAVPAAGFTVPALETRRSSAAPALAVDVWYGVVTEDPITVSAWAMPITDTRATGVRQVAAKRLRMNYLILWKSGNVVGFDQ